MKKILLIFLVISISQISYSQSVVEKYNSLYNRYEYFDSSGNMIGYKTYNSLYNQWEYYDVKGKRRETDFGKYVPPVNLELVARVLAQKQARYDNLSYEQKLRLKQQKAYRNYQIRKNNNIRELNKLLDKANKRNDKIVKRGIKNFDKNLYKDNKDIREFSDGWYKCFFVSEGYLDGSDRAVSYERFIQVFDGNVINYIGNHNIIYPITKNNMRSSFLELTLDVPYRKSEQITIYCVSDKPLNKPPDYKIGVTKLFYTTAREGGDIEIVIKNNGEYGYIGTLDSYWKDDSIINCNVEDGVVKITLPVGNYEYYAYGDINRWHGEFTLKEGAYCHKTKLVD